MKGESVDPIRPASNKRNKTKPEFLSTAMDGSNGASIVQDKLGKLKKLFPEIFTEGKVDPEKLRIAIGEDLNIQNERYVLNWAGKSDAFRVLQTPTTATLAPTSEGIGDFNQTQNVFIEGENLEVLKILQKSYYGKIKMIYIDPPYNTGSDEFIYPDKFSESKEDYLKRIGEKDEEGYLLKEGLFRKNSKESGQYHSNWLSMMYPRLFLARNLLKDDGVIFVSIDDNEVHNLRLLMNEVFGEENFVEQIVWKNKFGAGAQTKGFIGLHEYVLCYVKDINIVQYIDIPYSEKSQKMYNKKDENYEKLGPFGTWPLETTSMDERPNLRYPIIYKGKKIWPKKQWLWSKERVEEAQKKNLLVINEKNGKYSVRFKGYLYDGEGNMRRGKPLSIFDGPYTQEGTKDLSLLFKEQVFAFPKPKDLIKKLLNCNINGNSNKDDLILDFFAGSGPTAHAVIDLNKEDGGNRKFICVQLPEQCKEDSEAYKAGYKTIADICKERIRRVIKKIAKEKKDNPSLFKDKTEMDLEFKVFKLKNSNFKIWRSDVIENGKDLEKQIDVFEKPVKLEAKINNMVWEILLKSGYDLNTKIEEKKVNGCEVYSAAGGEIIIALSKISQSAIKEIIKLKPKKCRCLDSLFAGNDQLKTNTVLQMKDSGIEFRTI